jgi:hypothetical protein
VITRLRLLDDDDPCSEPFQSMVGFSRIRCCGRCGAHVYDLSGLAPAAARALVDEYEVDPAVRLVRRADGTASAGACAPLRHATACASTRRAVLVVAGIAAVLITAAFVGVALG